jgi:hypothetical protein
VALPEGKGAEALLAMWTELDCTECDADEETTGVEAAALDEATTEELDEATTEALDEAATEALDEAATEALDEAATDALEETATELATEAELETTWLADEAEAETEAEAEAEADWLTADDEETVSHLPNRGLQSAPQYASRPAGALGSPPQNP